MDDRVRAPPTDAAPDRTEDAGTVAVLLVDDEPDVADLLKARLEAAGDLSVVVETDPTDAVERLDSNPIDCVVSDYHMPTMDGLELLAAVRERRPDLPFVLFTGKGTENVASRAISMGATDYLRKDFGEEAVSVMANRITNAVERYRAERERERTRRQYRALIEHSADLVTVVDADGTVTYQSPAVERVLGHDPKAVVGDRFLDYVHPADRGRIERRRRETSPGDVVEGVQFRMETADGEWRWIEATASDRIDGVVGGYVVNGRDVTERKERKEALEDQRAFVESLLDALPDVFYAYDETGSFYRFNDRLLEATGYDADAVESMHPVEFFPEDHHDRVREAIEAVLDGEVRRDEAPLLTRDGDRIPYEFTGAPLYDADGDVIGVVGIGRDVADRRERERELEQYEAIVESMDDVAHTVTEEYTFGRFEGRDLDHLEAAPSDLEGTDVGRFVDRVIDDEDADRYLEALRAVVEGDSDGERLTVGATADDRFYADVSITPLREHHEGAAVVARDVTDREHRRRELELKDRAMDEASVGITITDPDRPDNPIVYANDGFESVTGYPAEEVVGRNCRFLQGDGTDPQKVTRVRRAVREGDPVEVELRNYRADGTEFWNRLQVTPITDGDGTVENYLGFQQDVTERKRYERALATLHGVSRRLLGTETPADVADLVTEAAAGVLDVEAGCLFLHDEEANVLEPASWVDGTEAVIGHPPTFDPGEAIAWDVFVEGEARVYDDVSQSPEAYDPETPIRSELLIPVGDHGVFVCGSTTPGEFGDRLLELADLLAAGAEAALDRHERDRRLRESDRELQRRNERLRQLDEINERVRAICHDVVDAETSQSVYETVCRALAEVPEFEFVWVGERNRVREAVVPEASDGDGRGYLDATDLATDRDGKALEPAARTATRGRSAVVDRVADELREGDWQRTALTRDYRSAMSVPLRDGDVQHGVLSVYAGSTGAFDDDTRAVLRELGRTVGAALGSVQRRRALASDHRVQLEFGLYGTDGVVPSLGRRVDGRFVVDGVVSLSEGFLAYGTATGVDADRLRELAGDRYGVDDVEVLRTDGGAVSFELHLSAAPTVETAADHGARFHRLAVEDGTARLAVSLAASAQVTEFVELFCDRFSHAELRAKREREAPVDDGGSLTERQREALATAYHSGYYEWPRETDSEAVAESLGITKPTFLEHLRLAEATVVERFLYSRAEN